MRNQCLSKESIELEQPHTDKLTVTRVGACRGFKRSRGSFHYIKYGGETSEIPDW